MIANTVDLMQILQVTTYAISLMSIVDVSLTYYILWADRKLHPKNPKWVELNGMAALIMKATNFGPWGLFFGMLLSQILIWVGVFIMVHFLSTLEAIIATNVMLGALFVVIWIHLHSIQVIQKIIKGNKIIREELGE